MRNPNARKIASRLATPDLMGLVAVTNAEKVILNRAGKFEEKTDIMLASLSEEERREYEAQFQANELREQIARIPSLCVLIDEVHHANDDQILRRVVNRWMKLSNFNSVLGFSGTPYMDPAVTVKIDSEVSVKNKQYANVVDYYPLIEGLGNFLKTPVVRHSDLSPAEIIDNGLREFLDKYIHLEYGNGAKAKVAVYAPSIAVLEEEIFPQVCAICADYGLDPNEAVLKFHKGNQQYKVADDAQLEFSTLDSPLSRKRIVLLVQIGREGWNCRSLTSVILSQKNACPQNMVLQTSCRCLREVDRAADESALIWLNKFNADKLNDQLQKQQFTTLAAFSSHRPKQTQTVERFSRTDHLKLPPIDYYQFKVSYAEVVEEEKGDAAKARYFADYEPPISVRATIYTQNMSGEQLANESAAACGATRLTFNQWIALIARESFGTLPQSRLRPFFPELEVIFSKITKTDTEGTYLNPNYDQEAVRGDIRKAFIPRRSFNVSKELIPEEARLLKISQPTSPYTTGIDAVLSPSQPEVERILSNDKNPPAISQQEMEVLLALKARGVNVTIPETAGGVSDRTCHYLPYHLDSSFESGYYDFVRKMLDRYPGVEAYFNGDDNLTEFKIHCYSKTGKTGKTWRMIGDYYPDFLLLTRKPDNSIHRVVIVETKGEGFAAKFAPRKEFMERIFVRCNNEEFHYDRFRFLYIEDTMPADEQRQRTEMAIEEFLTD